MADRFIINTPYEMKNKCACCLDNSQYAVDIDCRYRPGYDDIKKVWTDLPALISISFCKTHLLSYQKNREEHDRQYGIGSHVSSGKDWWDILDGILEGVDFTHNQ
jgi:hypothetical protein